MITLRDIATKHNMDPHSLRVLIRSTGIRAQGRWVWEDDDPFLVKIEELIQRRPPSPAYSPKHRGVEEERKVPASFKVPPKQDKPKDVSVPPASRLIERLDRLAACGKYDDVALAFSCQTLIYNWDENRLQKAETLIQQNQRPEAFIGFKWHGSQLNARIRWNPEARSGLLTLPTSRTAHRSPDYDQHKSRSRKTDVNQLKAKPTA